MRRLIAATALVLPLLGASGCADDDEAENVAVDCAGGPIGEVPMSVEEAQGDLGQCQSGLGVRGFVFSDGRGKVRLCSERPADGTCGGATIVLAGFSAADITPTMTAGEVVVRGFPAGIDTIEPRDIAACDETSCP